MYLVDRFVLMPAKCYVCGSAELRPGEGGIVDTLRDITDGPFTDGRLYLCRACVVEMGMMYRFAPPELVDRFVTERDAAILQVRELTEELETLREVKAAIEQFRPAPVVELVATPRYVCQVCLDEGVSEKDADKNNPQGLGRHAQSAHGLPYSAVRRGDEVLQAAAESRPKESA